jgi:ABC-type Fe3+/spermidine/putrescine transport system ATPase subunit
VLTENLRPMVGAQSAANGLQAVHHLQVASLWKRYDAGPYVVTDVSFTLEQGEFLTLLGPSGSGKTTILMMVAGFELPTRGAILVDGRNIAGLAPDKRNFGVVFQGYALFPHMTVRENVEFGMRMRGQSRRQCAKRAMDILDKVGLVDFAGRKPRELSGGQQQRVALARALVFEPDALLLDEPLGALDRRLREALQLEIKEIQRRVGVSILFITHDQEEAMMMSDRIAVMRNGRIVQIGNPVEIYQHPRTPFVANFLGETNLIPVFELHSSGDIVQVQFANGGVRGLARKSCEVRSRAAGTRITLSLRPERIRVLSAGESADNVIDGNLLECTFLGRHIRCVVEAMNQRLLLSVNDPGAVSRFERGARLRLGWGANDAQLLAESDDSG